MFASLGACVYRTCYFDARAEYEPETRQTATTAAQPFRYIIVSREKYGGSAMCPNATPNPSRIPRVVTYAGLLYWATPSPLFRGVCRNVPSGSSKKACLRTALISLSVPRCEKKRCCCCCYGEANSQTAVSQAEDEIVLRVAALLSIRRWKFITLSTNKKTHNKYKVCLGSMPSPADNILRD